MPFWRNLLSNALLFSLQDSSIKYGQHALNSRKPKDRIAGWIRRWICPGRKKASRRALPAGMTVEAAVVLPVFLFAVANLLSLFLVFWTYSSKEAQLHQTARQLALYAYGQEDGEPDVRLMRLTPVSAPFGTAAFRSSYVVNGCVMHKWIGYSGDGTGEDWERQEEELVYITKSGEAYHRERSCLYLNPSIRLADREEITADYTPCSVCVGRGRLENRLIYVTDGGMCCSVTDCKRRKITLSVLLAGAAAGCILSGIRIWQGTESAWEMLAAILPAVCLESVVILTAGKVGSVDAGMLLVFGLLLGWKACVSILCMGCLLIGVVAGCGMGIGVFHQNSRLPFAPFLFAATVITQLLQT